MEENEMSDEELKSNELEKFEEPRPPLDADRSARRDRRRQRIDAYEDRALAAPDDLQSNVASLNCGLFRIGHWLEETIDEAISAGPTTPERTALVFKTIDTHLRVARQIDRFAEIERRTEARKQNVTTLRTIMPSEPWSNPNPISSEDFQP
jgi:hypothetical protein